MYRKYRKLPDEHYTSSFVPRKDRPTRGSMYYSNQGSFQHTFPPSVVDQQKGNNSMVDRRDLSQDEPKEMLEHLSYRDPQESRDDHSMDTGYPCSRPNQREAPPVEEIEYPSHPRHNYSTRHVRYQLEEDPRESSHPSYPNQPVKEAEYLSYHDRSTKRAEYFSHPNHTNHTQYEHTHPWKDIKYVPRSPPEDSILSPPRLSRHSTNIKNHHRQRGEIMVTTRTHRSSAMAFPTQTHHRHRNEPKPFINTCIDYRVFGHRHVGNPALGIHRMRLPLKLLRLLDQIVHGCEEFAHTLVDGWSTDLYSLTKQDLALTEIPHVYRTAGPIMSFVKRAAGQLYGIDESAITLDKNQPHVVKYSGRHKGVEMHHDKCDITMNIMLSRSNEYVGGGTYFRDAGLNVRLEFGEFLLHPGAAIHAGTEITEGKRFLMVMFADAKVRCNFY